MKKWRTLGRPLACPCGRVWVRSDLCSLGQLEGVLHIDAKVAHRALNPHVTKQNLNGFQVARRLEDEVGRRDRASINSAVAVPVHAGDWAIGAIACPTFPRSLSTAFIARILPGLTEAALRIADACAGAVS